MSQVSDRGKNHAVVLIVERNTITWPLTRYILQEAGYRVEFAQDGRDALTKARELSPALVMTDLFVPEVNGIDLCRSLKSDERTRPILVIIASHLAVEAEAKAAGADAFLRRPLDLARLTETFQRFLEKKTS